MAIPWRFLRVLIVSLATVPLNSCKKHVERLDVRQVEASAIRAASVEHLQTTIRSIQIDEVINDSSRTNDDGRVPVKRRIVMEGVKLEMIDSSQFYNNYSDSVSMSQTKTPSFSMKRLLKQLMLSIVLGLFLLYVGCKALRSI